MKIKITALILIFALVVYAVSGCGLLEPDSSDQSSEPAADEYTGSGMGYGGELTVSVRIADGKIEDVAVTLHSETERIAAQALEELPGTIVAQQSLGVDVVAGATLTSQAILAAVADALTKAGLDPRTMGYMSVSELSDTDVITLIGLPGGDVTLTGLEIKSNFPQVEFDSPSINSSGTEVPMAGWGVTLESILQSVGASQMNYQSIIFTATDGYMIEVPYEVLQSRDIVIAYEVNGEAQNLRTVVLEERAMYRVKFLSTIELLGESTVSDEPVAEILILETMIAGIMDKAEDYKYYDAVDQAVAVTDLIEAYIPGEKPAFVNFLALDGLEKNERYDNFWPQHIKFTGEKAPMFIGVTLPEGMRVSAIVTLRIGGTAIASVPMGQAYTENPDGLNAAALFELVNMVEAAEYIFIAADGYESTIAAGDIAKGNITVEADGSMRVRFAGLEGSTSVRNLLQIKAVQ